MSVKPNDCDDALQQEIVSYKKSCQNATGIDWQGMLKPIDDTQRKLLCSECTKLYTSFTSNAYLNCKLGFSNLNQTNAAIAQALCPTPAPITTIPPTTTVLPKTTVPPIPTIPSVILQPTTTQIPVLPPAAATITRSRSHAKALIAGTIVAALCLVVLGLLMFWWKRRRRQHRLNSVTKHDDSYDTVAPTPTVELAESWNDPTITAIRIPLEKIKVDVLLSRGAFGEVYRGTYNDQHVAIKKIRPARRRLLTHIHVFLDEIKRTASLEHSCIVRFVGVAWDSLSDLCMVTEFMPGGNLRELLMQYDQTNRPQGFDTDKLKIAVHVAHALTYLHSLEPVLVHRDVKSRNILLTDELDAKLMDFGVSRETVRNVTMTAAVGTSLWMAPEVMLGERYDEKADIFSFGIVLSELDTHAKPYSHILDANGHYTMSDLVIMQLVSQGQLCVQFSTEADASMVTLVRACLQLDPVARPTSAQVLHYIHRCWRAEM